MQMFYNLSSELTAPLERYRQWVFEDRTRLMVGQSIAKKPNSFLQEDRAEYPCSAEYLRDLDHSEHQGFPIHMHGIDLNYRVLQNDRVRVSDELFKECRQKDIELDEELQTFLGAKYCALKAYYPEHGHIGWHTNWNAPGYNIIFTYSPSGAGYWRHIEPDEASQVKPDLDDLVHVQDAAGWHCKVGYFGGKKELDRVVWHCAYTPEPRLTVSYVIYDKTIWQNMVDEIKASSN